MPTYQYWAKNADGHDIKGTKDAQSVGALVSDLKREGLIVINVEEPGAAPTGGGGRSAPAAAAAPSGPAGPEDRLTATKRKPVRVRDLAVLCRQLSTMLKAGLSIIDAFETIANESDNLTMQETMFEMRDDIEAGSSLSEAINKHPKIFSLMFRAMIEAGEASGSLTKIVGQLGEYLKKRDALQRKIKAALMYPKFVMGFFALIVTGILLFLVPQFESTFASLSKPCKMCSDPFAPMVKDPQDPKGQKMKRPPGPGKVVMGPGGMRVGLPTGAPDDAYFKVDPNPENPRKPIVTVVQKGTTGAQKPEKCPKCDGHGVSAPLPAMTQALLDLSRIIKNNLLYVIAAVILLVILWKKYSSSDTGKQQLDRLVLKLPVAGNIALKSSIARFCLTLSTLLNNGVSLDHSLDIVSRVAGNTVVEEATQQVRELIIQGQGLSESMARFPIFPPLVNKMVSVGEESGALAEMLTDISDYYEEEVNSVVEGISSVIEPLMIVLIGAVVCVVVLALYLPIFKMADAVGG